MYILLENILLQLWMRLTFTYGRERRIKYDVLGRVQFMPDNENLIFKIYYGCKHTSLCASDSVRREQNPKNQVCAGLARAKCKLLII